jgi:hypothetical protein
VNCTTPPGVVVAAFHAPTIDRRCNVTAVTHAGFVFPTGHVFPDVDDVTAVATIPLPTSGVFTVTENVTVAATVGAKSPDHDTTPDAKLADPDPEVTVASPL